MDINFNSVESIPSLKASAVFMEDSSKVFREDVDILPVKIDDERSYMPWGGDNLLPYKIIDLIERDETLSTCQIFNAETCYSSGLKYEKNPDLLGKYLSDELEVEEFFENNDIPSYFLGNCQDFKFFGFAVSVIILNTERTKIVRIIRKEACYCRFAPADEMGKIPYILYGNWRNLGSSFNRIEKIPLLDFNSPLFDLRKRINDSKEVKFAIVTRIPTPDSTYYPIPFYASLFKGKWYNIKQLIGTAKESKLKNSAPIQYHIEISNKYWENMFRAEGITDPVKQRERVAVEKQNIIDFLTGAENSGKVWFSLFYSTPDGREVHDVKINKIDSSKAGGDYESDIQEAINIICFTMRVHSNLVGSVPGKSQSNNSGSDKRELYTIAQSLQKPYHDIMFAVHRLIISFNGWRGYRPVCNIMQLTTLDEHKDIKEVSNN